jgi:hypothetical protein
MKRILVLLGAMIVCGQLARADDVKVEVTITNEPGGEGMTSFAADTEKVLALFKTEGAQNGDKIRALWIAEDVGGAAPANSNIDEKTLTMEGDTEDGVFSVSKPTNGWPAGTYRLDIYVNDKLTKTEKFAIGSSKNKEVEEPEDSLEPQERQEPTQSDYAFKVHNTTKKQITKLLASEDGEKYAPFDVGSAGVNPGQTVTLNWDKSPSDSECEWFIKAVLDDGSETLAKRFDFCEEDLQLDF